ncbi:MAG: TetR/AcrR family transcriptional regulator, partial [Alphaproteobacteria bacterium]
NALSVRPRLHEARVHASTLEEFVRETFLVFFDFCVTDRGAYAVMRRNSGQMRVRMDTPEVIAGFDELRADLEAAIAKGLAPPVDAGFLTASLIGIAFEIADEMFRREPFDAEAAAEFATALFLGGVEALPRTG